MRTELCEVGDTLVIGGDIIVTVLAVHTDSVDLSVDSPSRANFSEADLRTWQFDNERELAEVAGVES